MDNSANLSAQPDTLNRKLNSTADESPAITAMASVNGGLVPERLKSQSLCAREVRVEVRAVGINPVDWKLMDIAALRLAHSLLGPSGPFVTGLDFAGVVSEVGRGVKGVKVGDAVAGTVDFRLRQRGSYASEVVVRDSQLAPIPSGLDFETAACLPVAGVTAHMALFEKGGLSAIQGGKVLILGASGGVGHLAVQFARNHGAQVFGVCSSKNAGLVTGLGATVITHDEGDALEKAAAHGPFDVVVNAVSGDRYPSKQVARLISPNGRQILLMPGLSDFPRLATGSVKTFSAFPTTAKLTPLLEDLAAGKFEIVVSERFSFRDVEQAHHVSRTGRVVGKMVLMKDDADLA